MKISKLLALLPALAIPTLAQGGMVYIDFAGGDNTPLTVTFPQPITFTLLEDSTEAAPAFVIQGTGALPLGFAGLSSNTVTFTINSGAPIAIDYIDGDPGVDVQATDCFIGSTTVTDPLSTGAIITLSAGSFQTTDPMTASAPASGYYNMEIMQGGNTIVASTSVPEPSTYAAGMGLMALAGTLFIKRRRR